MILQLDQDRIELTSESIVLYMDSYQAALQCIRERTAALARWALEFDRPQTLVRYPGCKRPFRVLASMSSGEKERLPQMRDRELNLLGADYLKILEFLMEQRQEGKIVIITSNTTNICYHTSDLLKPSRAHWSAAKFTGYNYLRSWRADRAEDPNNPRRLNPQFDLLREVLSRDGYAPGYEYTLYRPDDALCSYQTDYYLCRDYCGDEVRIGVSRVEDWRLLEPAVL